MAHQTLQERTYRELRRALMVGLFAPGEVVSLRTLAARLGTSPMPVREAVNRLIAERGLVLRRNRTVAVPEMTRARFIELANARQALEGLAAKLCCERATTALIAKLERVNRELIACARADDATGCLASNQRFHFAVYEHADAGVILPLIESLWLQAGPFMYLSLMTPGVRWNAKEHTRLIAALRRRDAEGARKAIERDVATQRDYLLSTAAFS